MHGKPPSLIRGLDPAALLALDEDESAGTEWQPPSLEEAARLFPQWKVIRLLGRGGMGAVYEMHQPELDRTVAVKLLPIEASGDEHLVERFRREARTLAKLHHPGIVALFESGMTAAGHFYFVMEHVNGSPLSQWISEGRLSVAKAIEIVRQVCDALAYAHAQGVIHRDIKPSNILLDAQGRAKVADFGLARLEQAQSASGALTVSHTGQFMGTPAYAAPEQVKDAAHVDHRADIYALGVLLYEMLTGDLPRGVFQPPSRKSGSDAHLDEVVRRAMQERPEDRYQAAAELQQDISRKRKGGKAWLLLFMVVIAGAGVMWVPRNGANVTDRTEMDVAETKEQAVSPQTDKAVEEAKRAEPVKAASKAIPAPVEPAPTAATVHVWSIDPVSPALQPPAALTKQAWKDAVLTSTGGTVLHPDGSISVWDEKRPNAVQRLDLHAAAIASSGDDVFMLDAKGGVVRLRDSKIVAEGLRAIFSFSQAGTLPALTSDENLVWIEIDSGTRKPLPKPPGAILRLAMLEGETLGCLLQSGDLLILEGSAFVKSSDASKHRAADLHAGDGFTLMVDENGRCMLSGIKIPNSPQRFRLPENAKNIRVGPLGRLVAW